MSQRDTADKTCGRCAHFDHDKAVDGVGPCKGYEGAIQQVQPFVRFDGPFCVLFRRAADVGPRRRFIERQIQKQQGEAA